MILLLLALLVFSTPAIAQDYSKLRIIAFGAHPDDCDETAGGVAAKYAAAGHQVKFVAVTNGDAGHHQQGGGVLAQRRRAEAIEAGRRIGVVYEVLDNHDGELMPTLEVRRQIIRLIRQWNADIVMGPRPNDYHPDHRYTGVLVQDAAFMVTVPNVVTDTPALRKNPVFLYFADEFQRPQPFRPDIVVAIDDVIEKKIDMLDAHVSQMYEWLPWHDGLLDQVPKNPGERKAWLRSQRGSQVRPEWRPVLQRFYGAAAASFQNAEAFEIAEYGRRPDDKEIMKLFPFFPGSH
ncbi:MAG TPA: PIG-L family deacetylase [Terriglobia bacterium]|nr:PIG-L family deacetylase [Terriglobia bacterium]